MDDITHTVAVVAAYVSRNAVPADQLPDLIFRTHAAIMALKSAEDRAGLEGFLQELPKAKLEPAVPIKKSVHADYIVCLEDGKKFKSMRRHLKGLGMTPEEYKAKWGLPADYPIVCSSYSAKRSVLATANGLGRRSVPVVTPENADSAANWHANGGRRG